MEFFNTHISKEAIALVNSVLESGWLSEGKCVREFEIVLEKRLGLVNPVALNSGTSALHLALVLADVGTGDEVILPAQTFVATGLVILMQNAIPVFADIDPTTGNISPASIAEKITFRTKAVMPVHWGGYPCDMDEINAVAGKYNLIVIEDAAHALGATYHGKPIGAISDFTAFSFQAIKHLTTADGGALCCKSNEKARRAFIQRWFGIDRVNSQPSILGERTYDIAAVGYKYHMNDFSAALGLGNLQDLSQRLQRRQQIANLYQEKLAGIPGIQLRKVESDRTSANWLFTLLVEKREDFIRRLGEHGIPASVVHLRIDHNSVFGGTRDGLPGQAVFNEKQVSIPVHEKLSNDDAEYICSIIRRGW
jgi:perosamine synthetase